MHFDKKSHYKITGSLTVQRKPHEVDMSVSQARTSWQPEFKTRSVCLPRSLKFKYEKGGRRDMVNKTTNLSKAKTCFLYIVLDPVKRFLSNHPYDESWTAMS